jgi:xylulokinase
MEGLKINAFFWPFIPGRWVVGGMTITGGSSLEWIRNCIGSISFQELAQEAEQAPAGSRGIIFLPYLMGRGTPFPLENARAAFINLDIAHTRGEVVRAVMEGVGFALREIFAEFELRGFELGDVRITGGGARVGLWRQIMAGILNRRIVHAGGDATLGAAMIVATASGRYQDFPSAVDRMVHIRDINEPNAEHAAGYQQTYEEFLSLSSKLGFRQALQR